MKLGLYSSLDERGGSGQGQDEASAQGVNDFIAKVNQDYAHRDITLAQKDEFVSLAQDLINDLQ
jgi:hypothetical protein